MTEYRRPKISGATWFFTVNLAQRHNNRLLAENIEHLRNTFHKVKVAHPFGIDAIVVLPDHIHCIWTLPEGDSDYATRWGLIKAGFSRGLAQGERRSASRVQRGERGIWQRRFWEHMIRDEGISGATSTTSIGTQSNMAGAGAVPIGHSRAFMRMSSAASMRRIGQANRVR